MRIVPIKTFYDHHYVIKSIWSLRNYCKLLFCFKYNQFVTPSFPSMIAVMVIMVPLSQVRACGGQHAAPFLLLNRNQILFWCLSFPMQHGPPDKLTSLSVSNRPESKGISTSLQTVDLGTGLILTVWMLGLFGQISPKKELHEEKMSFFFHTPSNQHVMPGPALSSVRHPVLKQMLRIRKQRCAKGLALRTWLSC